MVEEVSLAVNLQKHKHSFGALSSAGSDPGSLVGEKLKRTGLPCPLWRWYGGRYLRGIAALHAAGAYGGGDVVVGLPGAHGGINVCVAGDEAGGEFYVSSAGLG